LQKLINLGWICHSVLPLATAIPIAENYQLVNSVWDEQQSLILSRFAFLPQENQQFVLESPLSKAKIILLDWRAAALIAKLAQVDSSFTLLTVGDSLIDIEIARSLIQLLIATGMISLEPESEALAEWQFHNLLFHRQTRSNRLDDARKSKIPHFEDSERSHILKPWMSDLVISLEKPHLEALAKTDISLTQAIESRQSIREYDNQPITLQQLGEFLYRCARVKEVYTLEDDPMNIGECTKRPYPCGGALYELEIYPVINRCQGLDAGLYHYQPLSHTCSTRYRLSHPCRYFLPLSYFPHPLHHHPQRRLKQSLRPRHPGLRFRHRSPPRHLQATNACGQYQWCFSSCQSL
jgi:hypothetical protein